MVGPASLCPCPFPEKEPTSPSLSPWYWTQGLRTRSGQCSDCPVSTPGSGNSEKIQTGVPQDPHSSSSPFVNFYWQSGRVWGTINSCAKRVPLGQDCVRLYNAISAPNHTQESSVAVLILCLPCYHTLPLGRGRQKIHMDFLSIGWCKFPVIVRAKWEKIFFCASFWVINAYRMHLSF